MILLFAAAAVAGCGKKGTKALDPADFNLDVALNENFYEHFTGGWQQNNPLKPEFARYGSFDVLRENNEYRIKELFASLEKQEAAQGTVNQKIGDLYRMGLDSVALNAAGAEPLAAGLQKIASVGSRKELGALIGWLHRYSSSPLFGGGVYADAMDSNTNVFNIDQSGLSMGERDYYLEEDTAPIREAFKKYIATVCQLSGYSEADAARIVESVMEVETSLAEAHFSNVELRDPYKNYNMLSRADFLKQFRNIDWNDYAEALGMGAIPEKIQVSQLPAMKRADRIVGRMPLQTIKDYLTFQYVDASAPYLSDAFGDASFDFYGRTLSGKQEQRPRWKRALGVPNSLLSEAVGELYVEKYFPAAYKAQMLDLVGNLQTSLGQHIENLEWMSPETKTKAAEKLAAFTVKIGYPDKWKDYSTLSIDPSLGYLENLQRASGWYRDDNLADLGKPVDRDRWYMSPQTVNAYYNPLTNEICFPAAILQFPFFNPEADDAVNYGAIGVVIGHEMTHGFDDQGRQYDKDGNLKDWWTKEDAEAFDARAQKLTEQFDAIEVLPGVNANGKFTLGENIADQGGLRVAYTALQNKLGGEKLKPIDGFTPEQRFYVSYAKIWAQNIRDEEAARLTKIDPHSLGKWRVNGTLPNIPTFYEAFGITDGAMFRPAEERVIIW